MGTRVRPRLILVGGVPAAGKTTLARALGTTLHLPVLVRDDLKTGVADTLPETDWSDPAVRAALGGRIFDDFHSLVHAFLDRGSSLVAEAAWHWPLATAELQPLVDRADTTLVTVAIDPAVAAVRYRTRFEAGLRHSAHRDAAFADGMDGPDYDWRRYVPPSDLPWRTVTVDGALAPEAVLTTVLDALPR